MVWRFESYAGDTKPRKIPFWADGARRHGQQGSPQDLARLTTFAAARDAAIRGGFDGVGFAHTRDSGIVILDFDNAVTDGVVQPEVTNLVFGTYAEYSPSGRGVHAVFRADASVLANGKSLATPEQFGVEAFSSAGFTTFTGWMLDHVDLCGYEDTVAPLPQHVTDFCRHRFGKSGTHLADNDDPFAGLEPQIGLSVEQMQTLLAGLDPDMGRDDWIRVGMALHHECEGEDTGFDLWNDWSENGGKYPSEEALRAQWDSFTRRMGPGRRQITMASVLKMAKEAGVPLPRPTLAASAEDLKAVAADTAEKIADLPPSEGVCTPEGFEGRFRVYSAESLAQRDPIGWLIKGVLPDADMGVLFGASGSGKSFAALDMAGSIARGVDWRGRRVRKGRVIVIAAEGGGGYGKRIKAYCQHHNIAMRDLDIGVITAAPNFLEADDISEVVASIVAAGGASLLIVDTFAQVTPGAN